MVIVYIAVHDFHHFIEHLFVFSQQILFVADAIVELVEFQRLFDEVETLVKF